MYFGAGIARLTHATKHLRQAWERTEDDWRDDRRREFERQHIEPTLHLSGKALRAMDELADLFARIQRDLS
jgi:hypothetical protein